MAEHGRTLQLPAVEPARHHPGTPSVDSHRLDVAMTNTTLAA